MNSKLNTMPGFTAEDSLYKTSESYRMAGVPIAHTAGVVLPQQIRCGTICDTFNRDECTTICCDDSGIQCIPIKETQM